MKKLNLKDLKVASFVTSEGARVVGGYFTGGQLCNNETDGFCTGRLCTDGVCTFGQPCDTADCTANLACTG